MVSRPRCPRPLLALLCASMGVGASAQTLEAPKPPVPKPEPSVVLKPSLRLEEPAPSAADTPLPTFLFGDSLTGQIDLQTVIDGNAELRRPGTVVRADRLTYDAPDDTARAQGKVRVNREGNVFEGDELELKLDTFEGFFNDARYRFLKNDAYGTASRIDFIDDKRSVVRDATYTTCQRKPGPSWMPDWVLNASVIRLDTEQNQGVAEGAVLRFQNVPVLPVPYLTFPLSEERKSGVLPPTFGADNINGVELSLPYYWNIAPNRDATFYPTLMSKRGIDIGAEFRYLEDGYSGRLRGNLMPTDSLRDRQRWALSYGHTGVWKTGLGAVGDLGVRLDINRVSDDNYWRDFADASGSLTQRLLSSDAQISWSGGPFAVSARALKWQTLQDVESPIVPPYDRLPQITASYTRNNWRGMDLALASDFTHFRSDPFLTKQPNARRSVATARLSRPWLAPGWFITPALEMHATRYQFSNTLANGARSASRVVPGLSIDTGLIFERDASYFGRGFRQTLEPRAFYSYRPFRDQSLLPNYDTSANDFNFASIFSDTPYSGNDRIADNNLLTLGATSRLLDPNTGTESARFALAQRFRFKPQRVTLPGEAPVNDRLSDILAGVTLNWTDEWALESTVQYNPKLRQSQRATLGARYSAGNYRVLSAAYRYQRDASEQIDFSWQWPLNDLWGDRGQELGAGRGQGEGRWYSVARLNYSLRDRRLVDSLVGLEYDAGCWLGRVVLERLQRSTATATQRILFQIEFVGFSRLGANPLQTLRNNIPRYQNLRERVSTPSRFGQYD
jgi:LPS-assembly protein